MLMVLSGSGNLRSQHFIVVRGKLMRSIFLVPAAVAVATCLQLSAAEPRTEQESAPFRAARVFITDSQSWEVSAGAGGSVDGFGAAGSGGARPQTAEIIKTFGERCDQVVINNKKEVADYIVVLDHEGGKSLVLRKNKVAVFERRSGDLVVSHSTRSLGNSVQDACEAISKHWQIHGAEMRSADMRLSNELANGRAKLNIASSPDGAEIEIDGAFMGNAPSVLELEPGDHTVTLRKVGYRLWQRKMRVSGGQARLNGALEPMAMEASAAQ
jgi:PEGA domain-containing protein